MQFTLLEGKREKKNGIQAQIPRALQLQRHVSKTKNSQTNHSLMKESKLVIRIKSPGRVGGEENDFNKCICNNFARSDS